MRKATTVKPQMWTKPGFLRLSSNARFVYAFLITGPDTNLTGIVRYPIGMVSMCTGLDTADCEQAMAELVRSGRVMWDRDGGIIFIIRWLKHNPLNSPKLVEGYVRYLQAFEGHPFSAVAVTLLESPDFDRVSIGYGYGMDTLQGEGEGDSLPLSLPVKNIIPRERGTDIPYAEIIGALNQAAGTSFRDSALGSRRLIAARWKEGMRLDDFTRVIRAKSAEWRDDPAMRKYLRPETLFNATKMESYLGTAPAAIEDAGFEFEPWK